MRWMDNHCHLPEGDEAAEVVAAARAEGVERMLDVGTDAESSLRALEAARTFEGVWATAGVHPHEATQGVEGLHHLLHERQVVAIGECGLDYHYDHSPRRIQRDVFAEQITLAQDHDLALVIHTREAWDDTFLILEAEGVPERTVLHCFTGGPAEARRALDMGMYVSFSGIVTFKGAGEVREAAAMCPLDRLLVETDAPYLAPVPHRGEANRPALVPLVGAAVAEARGVDVEEVAASSWDNAERLYRLEPSVPPGGGA